MTRALGRSIVGAAHCILRLVRARISCFNPEFVISQAISKASVLSPGIVVTMRDLVRRTSATGRLVPTASYERSFKKMYNQLGLAFSHNDGHIRSRVRTFQICMT